MKDDDMIADETISSKNLTGVPADYAAKVLRFCGELLAANNAELLKFVEEMLRNASGVSYDYCHSPDWGSTPSEIRETLRLGAALRKFMAVSR